MKRCWTVLAVGLVYGCAPKAVDLTPGAEHEGLTFSLIPSTGFKESHTFKHGEPFMVIFHVKNDSKKELPVFINYRGPYGVSFSRTLKNESTEFEALVPPPAREDPEHPQQPVVDNRSFMILQPGEDGQVYLDQMRQVAPKGGKPEPLPPGTYTYSAEYAVKTGYDGKYEGKGLPFDGDAQNFCDRSPRGVWRADCTFTITKEEAPARGKGPRGGRPM